MGDNMAKLGRKFNVDTIKGGTGEDIQCQQIVREVEGGFESDEALRAKQAAENLEDSIIARVDAQRGKEKK